jgi:transcription elongation factor GreA
VKIKNIANGMEMSYTIVPEEEADLKTMRISLSSPIAAGLLGKKIGEIADIKAPAGVMKFEVINISL